MCTILGYGLPEREICDIFLLSFIQTKWNQLSTDFVGPPFFQERSIVSHAPVNQLSHACLLTKWKKCNILSLFHQIHIVDSTFHQPQAGPPLSPERETYGMLLFIQLLHSCLLRRGKSATCYRYSYTLTYRILLSTTSQQRPGCQ